MAVPNCQHIVADLAARYPAEWHKAHNPSGGGPETEAFIRRLAWVLHSTVDPRFGLNGKRGNPNDLSDDALNFKGEGPGHDPTDGNRPVTVIDCIGGAGGPNPTPVWQVFDTLPGPGAWVKPAPVGDAAPAPTPIPSPWTAQHDDIVARLGTPNAAGDVGFVRRVAQQFRYTFGPGWGMKRAAPDRDLSNNVLGYQSPAGLFGFKVVPVRVKPEPLTLPSPQVFASVDPVDHLGLGSAPPVVTPPPPVVPPVVEPAPGPDPGLAKVLEVIVAGLADVSTRLQGVEAAVEKQRSDVLDLMRDQGYQFEFKDAPWPLKNAKGVIGPVKAPAKE